MYDPNKLDISRLCVLRRWQGSSDDDDGDDHVKRLDDLYCSEDMWHSDDDTNNVMYVVVYNNVTEFVHSRLLLDVSFDYCGANCLYGACTM